MYTQALNSGGGVAQRLNQHFFCPNPGPPGFCHKPLQPKGLQLFWFSLPFLFSFRLTTVDIYSIMREQQSQSKPPS